MCWSYIGLLAATSAEIALRLPPIQRLGAVGFALIFVSPIAVVFIGRYFLVRQREATIEAAKLNYKPDVPLKIKSA